MLIIVNIVFILFYLQVEPVYLRVSNKPIQITSCVINIGNSSTTLGQVCSPEVYIPTVMSLDDVRGHKQSASQRLGSTL